MLGAGAKESRQARKRQKKILSKTMTNELFLFIILFFEVGFFAILIIDEINEVRRDLLKLQEPPFPIIDYDN